ncbi:PREDICTED: uncharacterized protein LOC101293538 isoform 1 [Fragaria vesca subsp. vesca]|uniref:surfeit locus protein 6-like isoform X1 n=2 Tax=Fragaria vesca subsp. vesca TaxID=101020 RepID=UPI0002C3019A|nr:PREDICTED: surfeit locus protein 6-like isoform X1 [Fragaria vesca subsp. vesca]
MYKLLMSSDACKYLVVYADMGKKMKNKTDWETIVSNPVIDLKSIIHQHSEFMDKLVELIPARFYLPNDEDDKPWFQGLSKPAKASAKKETKKNIKQARRDRLDPEKTSTTTLDLLKQSLEKDMSNEDDSDSGEMETKPVVPGLEGDDRSVTYEELQQRLRRKIEQFQSGRNCGVSERARKRIERKERFEKGADDRKRKRETASDEKKPIGTDSVNKNVEHEVAEASKGLTFSRVKLGDDDEVGKKKRRLSKVKELERAKQLEEMKKDPEKGKSLLWKTATSRAAGVKVHDDPKLLKQSIKKDQKKHQKNAEKWKERVETTHKLKQDKQKKRSDNISAKLDEKKKRKIAKREKKLMRPGFEGRKKGYVNGGA